MKMTRWLLPFLVVPMLLAGCGGTTKAVSGGSEGPATLSRQSGAAYLRGLNELRNGDYAKSMETLQAVARGPSYVRYTALARLRLADALFYQEQFDEAAEGYRGFIELNASDPNLHYAYFRLAESRVRSIAGDFLLMPPSDRRDPQRVWAALNLLDDFVGRFPNSPHIDEALILRARMARTVSSYEMEVARFYMSRKKPAGAVNRIRRLMKTVPSVFRDEATHLALVEALAAAKDGAGLERQCQTYQELFPAGRYRSKVSKACASVVGRTAQWNDTGIQTDGG